MFKGEKEKGNPRFLAERCKLPRSIPHCTEVTCTLWRDEHLPLPRVFHDARAQQHLVLLPGSPCSMLGESAVRRVVGTVSVGREGSLCQRERGGEWMGQVWVRCKETRGFRERWVHSWGHGKLEYTEVTSKPDEISGDIHPPQASRNSGSGLLGENSSLVSPWSWPWHLSPSRAQA